MNHTNTLQAGQMNRNLPPATAQTETEMLYAVRALDRSLAVAEDLINELIQRLQPIIENRPQKEGDKVSAALRPMYSTFGQGIMDTSLRVEVVNARLTATLEALAI